MFQPEDQLTSSQLGLDTILSSPLYVTIRHAGRFTPWYADATAMGLPVFTARARTKPALLRRIEALTEEYYEALQL